MDKIKAVNPNIIVRGNVDKPYYLIEYYDLSDNEWRIGYGSYCLANVKEWLKTCFEVTNADVAPVKHGHIVWKEYHKGGIRRRKCLQEIKSVYIEQQMPCKHIAIIDERYLSKDPYCSECGKLLGEFLNYCGNCGAKMDD